MGYQENTPLFEVIEPLADDRYPEGYVCSETGEVIPEPMKCCPKCKVTKPTAAFMRRASVRRALTYTGSDVTEASPHHFVMDVVHNRCNDCHEHELKLAARKYAVDKNGKPIRIRRQSAEAYDAELRAHGRYEYMVPNPYRRYDMDKQRYIGNEFVPERYVMVMQYKEKQRQRRAEGTQAAKKRKYAADYQALFLAMKLEANRIRNRMTGVKKGKVRVITIDEAAQAFCKAYMLHLESVREGIRKARYAPTAIAPKLSPLDYINENSLATQQAKELYRQLSSKNQESLRPRYL